MHQCNHAEKKGITLAVAKINMREEKKTTWYLAQRTGLHPISRISQIQHCINFILNRKRHNMISMCTQELFSFDSNLRLNSFNWSIWFSDTEDAGEKRPTICSVFLYRWLK